MNQDEIIAPPHPDTIPDTIKVDVDPSGSIAVEEDNEVINHVQKRRLALIEDISPDGTVANPKERYLYMALLKDTADSAQSRISANNKADSSERDRALVAMAMEQLGVGMSDTPPQPLPETGDIPTVTKRLTSGEIDEGILATTTREETNDEFNARMAERMAERYAADD